MSIYAVVNTKGGVGKTTTAVHIATMLSRAGRTLLIDGDPQATAASWAAWRRDTACNLSPTTTRLQGRAVFDEGKGLAAGFDNTVIDAGGKDSAALRSALALADIAIVPVGASNFDSAAMTDLLQVAKMVSEAGSPFDLRILLSRVDARTRETAEMLEFLQEQNLQVFSSRIHERIAYRRATGEGLIVDEMSKGKDRTAIEEMDTFFKELQA